MRDRLGQPRWLDVLRQWNLTPARLALVYVAFGVLALFASDFLLLFLFEDPLLQTLQAIKGAVEVLVTGAFLYLLARWSWRDLRLKERAIDAAPIGITIADAGGADEPIVFANSRFEQMTGYDESEVLGRNHRFLQGEETDPEARERLREAIDAGRPVSTDVVNYRANGEKFWNHVDVAPVGEGDPTHYVGFQADITDRKIEEERLEVLNRVLRHNVRNKMNVIASDAETLRDREDPPAELERIERAVEDLVSLTETVRRNQAIVHGSPPLDEPVALDERLRDVIDAYRERYPEATFDLDLPASSPEGACARGLLAAIDEAIDNAVTHNDRVEPTVSVSLERAEDGWLHVAIEDDGPGIPGPEVDVLSEGETALKHADRLGIWSIYWSVNRAGGTMEITDLDGGGSRLSLSIPAGSG